MNELVAGQNAPAGERNLKFSVAATGFDVDVVGLVVDDRLQVLDSDDVVFFNQPATSGVTLSGGELSIDLATLRPGARVLCAVGFDDVPAELAAAGMRVELTGSTGVSAFGLMLRPNLGETALLCFELYQRSGQWKVRALGQGYLGGLAQLLTSHGVEVDGTADAADPVPEVRASRTLVPTDSQDLPPEMIRLGTDYGAAIARAHVIFEDAARSAAGFVQSERFALDRLDRELADALTDPSQRNSPEAARQREVAQKRCDDLVAAARERFDSDSRVLMAELAALDPQLPPAMASWQSPAWSRAGGHTGSGLRLAELSAPERGELRLPFCVPTPVARPLWVLESGHTVVPVVTSLTVRLATAARTFAAGAGDGVTIDILDLTGKLTALTELLAPLLLAPPVITPDAVAPRLDILESAIDLTLMALQAGPDDGGSRDEFGVRVVVISDLPFGWDHADLARLLRIVDRGSTLGWSFVFAGSLDEHDADPLVAAIADKTLVLPVSDHALAHDPWVGLEWSLAADQLDPQSEVAQQIVASLRSGQSPSNTGPYS
ncbi:TerD family protein [Williamsia sp.]|uniref:TerD family protein n=1 Tax=Williamsia sp. TaxID=1872085 RepID=UPI002F93D975